MYFVINFVWIEEIIVCKTLQIQQNLIKCCIEVRIFYYHCGVRSGDNIGNVPQALVTVTYTELLH